MTEIGLGHYLTLGAVIFSIGIIGIFLNRKNIIVILMSIELILFFAGFAWVGALSLREWHQARHGRTVLQ